MEKMITSSTNPQAKQIAAMMKKAKARNEIGAYIVEGLRMVEEIPKDDLISLFASESFLKVHPEWENRVVGISNKVFKEICGTQTPQGIMAIVRQKYYRLDVMLRNSGKEKPLLLILESIQDPGNLGTMIRMAEGAGASGIIMNDTTVDIYNPKVVRSTMGSIFRVPFVYTDELETIVQLLKNDGMHIYAAHLAGEHYYFEEDYTCAAGIMIGNEAAGLSDSLSALSDTYIKIPMEGSVESLNAAMAATILMYEARRQRIRK